MTFDEERRAKYIVRQWASHSSRVDNFLLPIILQGQVDSILDVGCGVGGMVEHLVGCGFDAHGVDLASMAAEWPAEHAARFAVVDPDGFRLPFPDGHFDFIYSLGVIEHVGTVDGNAKRHADYHRIRRDWLREVFRVLKPGQRMLIGGPNKGFPFDTHGPDAEANWIERTSRRLLKKATLHRTVGEYFLWNYKDFYNYLGGMAFALQPVSMSTYYQYTDNVPRRLRWLVKAYVDHIPGFLLGTGFNPWAIALIRKL